MPFSRSKHVYEMATQTVVLLFEAITVFELFNLFYYACLAMIWLAAIKINNFWLENTFPIHRWNLFMKSNLSDLKLEMHSSRSHISFSKKYTFRYTFRYPVFLIMKNSRRNASHPWWWFRLTVLNRRLINMSAIFYWMKLFCLDATCLHSFSSTCLLFFFLLMHRRLLFIKIS